MADTTRIEKNTGGTVIATHEIDGAHWLNVCLCCDEGAVVRTTPLGMIRLCLRHENAIQLRSLAAMSLVHVMGPDGELIPLTADMIEVDS